MEALYNVYFAGQIQDGQQLDSVKARLAKLFNADEQTLQKLFSGKAQLLKRNCDKATAVKYKSAIEKAGGVPVIKAAQETSSAAPQPSQNSAKQPTAAEKIAALAAAADTGAGATQAAEERPAAAAAESTAESAAADTNGIVLAPEGTEVLRESERAPLVENNIDTSALSVDEQAQRLSPETQQAPKAPDTSHLNMGEVGETIPTLPVDLAPVSPNTDAISLSPQGGDLSDCAAPEPVPPTLDLSALDVAPEGSAVLEEQYRKKETAQAPATDHLTLDS